MFDVYQQVIFDFINKMFDKKIYLFVPLFAFLMLNVSLNLIFKSEVNSKFPFER